MRVLFLDDDQERHAAFLRRMPGHEVHHVYTVAEAKAALDGPRFDLVHLDHDLGDYGPRDMYGYSEEYTGRHVARHMALMPLEKRPGLVVIHSWNPAGAEAMANELQNAGFGRSLLREPFSFDSAVP